MRFSPFFRDRLEAWRDFVWDALVPAEGEEWLIAGMAVVVALGAIYRATEPYRLPPPLEPLNPPAVETVGRVDPNSADHEMLTRLPGIGPALATRLIAARRNGGPFRSAKDLARVRGIGPKTVERLAPHLYFAEPEAAP